MATEEYLIKLMRDLCNELGLPEEKDEHAPILVALNQAYNRGAQGEPQLHTPCNKPDSGNDH